MLLRKWLNKMGSETGVQMQESINKYAQQFPVKNHTEDFPLIATRSEDDKSESYEITPTRRDWAYALQGVMLAQAGMTDSSQGQLLDLAF